jgi:glycosyltransferase involved in cell wall biosynthesis
MKILYHHRTASRDGQSTHIEEIVRGLRSLGHEVELCGPDFGGADHDPKTSLGWVGRLKALLPKPLYTLAELAYSLPAYRQIDRAIRRFQPDAIYERYNLFELSGIWAKRRHGIPLFLEVNSPIARERRQYNGQALPWLAQWAEHWVWRRADRVLPVTDVLADFLAGEGVARERLLVVPNGINPEHYAHLPGAAEAKAGLGLEGRLVIGFTGFVREWDRLDRIVRWMAGYRGAERLHLLVIGDGPARPEIEQCAREHGLSDQVSFTGVVRREEVPALSMAFDIALQTALVPYASPLCLFEYLALGKAILAPDQPNHHEILSNKTDSLLYDPDSDTGLEQGLETLVADAELRQRIAEAARTVIDAKRLTWRNHAERIAAEMDRLRGQKPL